MTATTRSRFGAFLSVDIRQLRLAIGLNVDQAAALIDEHPTLVQSQEQGGRGVDIGFVETCTKAYVNYAHDLVIAKNLPPMTSSQGTTAIYRFRAGLGLEIKDARNILGVTHAWLEAIESGSRAYPESKRGELWCGYADWAYRRQRRLDRAASLRRSRASIKPVTTGFSSEDVAEAQRLAYAPRLSPKEAEAEARRLLGLEA